MYVAFNNQKNPLKDYFDYYFNGLKVGQVISITGSPFLKTGTGKSYTALKIAENTDKDFNVDKVVYHPREFLEVIDKIEDIGKVGQVMITDEGEITAPASMYFSFYNKAMAYSMATFRYLRAMNIMVTPSFNWIDKRIRTLVSHWGYAEKRLVAGSKTEVRLKLYRVTTDIMGDNIYYKKITMYNRPKQKIQQFQSFKVGLPSDDLIEAYEKKSMDFKKGLRKSMIPELEKWESRDMKDEKLQPREIVDKIAEDTELLKQLTTQRGKMDLDAIKEKFPYLTYANARRVKRLTERMWEGS